MELFDFLIFGAIFFYIVQAVRRAAASQAGRRPADSVLHDDGERISERERLRRALASAAEWEEEERRREEAEDIRAELEELHARERGQLSPWRRAREEPAGAPPALSDALAGVAAMLDKRAGHPPPGKTLERSESLLEPGRREMAGAVVRREPASPSRRTAPSQPVVRESVEAAEARAIEARQRRASGPPFGELPGLARLTPLQRAVLYSEIFGRPVALRESGEDGPLD